MTGLDSVSKERNTLYFTLCLKKEGKRSFSTTVMFCVFHSFKENNLKEPLCFLFYDIKPLQGYLIIPYFMLCHKLEFFTDYAELASGSDLG